jgi:hypothetical protein
MAERKMTKGQPIQWLKEKWQKDSQYNGWKKNDKRTGNTMAERKMTKGQPTVDKIFYKKITIEQHEPH